MYCTTFYWHTQQKLTSVAYWGVLMPNNLHLPMLATQYKIQNIYLSNFAAQWLVGFSIGNSMPNSQEMEFISHESNRRALKLYVTMNDKRERKAKFENWTSNINGNRLVWWIKSSLKAMKCDSKIDFCLNFQRRNAWKCHKHTYYVKQLQNQIQEKSRVNECYFLGLPQLGQRERYFCYYCQSLESNVKCVGRHRNIVIGSD